MQSRGRIPKRNPQRRNRNTDQFMRWFAPHLKALYNRPFSSALTFQFFTQDISLGKRFTVASLRAKFSGNLKETNPDSVIHYKEILRSEKNFSHWLVGAVSSFAQEDSRVLRNSPEKTILNRTNFDAELSSGKRLSAARTLKAFAEFFLPRELKGLNNALAIAVSLKKAGAQVSTNTIATLQKLVEHKQAQLQYAMRMGKQ